MTSIKIKGHEIKTISIKNSYDRRAIQYKNNIIKLLSVLGLTEDDIEIELERIAIRKSPASCTWYIDGYRLHYKYEGGLKFVENLYVVWKVIEAEIELLLNKEKTFDEFCREFNEEDDIKEKRKEAREIIGVSPDCIDFELIHENYKKLAKENHPDMGGDLETFKKINNAHKMLKRELT